MSSGLFADALESFDERDKARFRVIIAAERGMNLPVKVQRGSAMQKIGPGSLAELVRMVDKLGTPLSGDKLDLYPSNSRMHSCW